MRVLLDSLLFLAAGNGHVTSANLLGHLSHGSEWLCRQSLMIAAPSSQASGNSVSRQQY
jgi:hypothetical protein